MRFLKLLLAYVVLFGGQLFAEDKAQAAANETAVDTTDSVPVALNYDQLVLVDGKKLRKVVIKSYDAKAQKLLLVANGKAMSLPIGSIPEPLASRFKAEAPQAGSSTSSAPEKKIEPSMSVSHPVAVQPAPIEPQGQSEQLGLHKSAALTRAQNYYRYEYPLGSDAARVTSTNFEVEDPEEVPGWTGRYRTRGKVFLEFFDSKGWSYRRTTSTFEVLTEQGKGSTPKVIDFSVKS